LSIENKPGNVTNVATEALVRAPLTAKPFFLPLCRTQTTATLYPNLSFNFTGDIAPIASVGRMASVMEINRSLPATSVDELITYAKASPGNISFASTGNGTAGHTVRRALQDDDRQPAWFTCCIAARLPHLPT